MNRRHIPLLVAALCGVVAVTSISVAAKATRQKRLAESENQTLRSQLSELKDRSARRRGPSADEAKTSQEAANGNTNALVALRDSPESPRGDRQPGQDRPPRESFSDRMARMQAEDPEGYAEYMKRRMESRQQMQYNMALRTSTIMDADTSRMTAEEKKNHDQLMAYMDQIWALTEKLQDPQVSGRESMGQMFDLVRQARPLMDQERTVLLRSLGTQVGYSGQEAQDFAAQIESIIDATTLQMPYGGSGRGGPGGGRGGSDGGGSGGRSGGRSGSGGGSGGGR